METVADIRYLNNKYGPDQRRRLLCPEHGDFTADLARYHRPEDHEAFLCPECDRELWLRFEPCETGRLAQRFPAWDLRSDAERQDR